MTTPLSKALMGAAALILMSQPVQAQDGDLWLQCRTTSSEAWDVHGNRVGGTTRFTLFDYWRISSSISIVPYDSFDDGTVIGRDNLCEASGAPCKVNDDVIAFQFRGNRTLEEFSIDRRSTIMTVTKKIDRPGSQFHGTLIGRMMAQCSRTTDPRPPAAF